MTPSSPRPARTRALRTKSLAGLDQVRALAHPLRMKLIELFAERPRTTKQAALQLGQPPTRLYHHVAALERAGLVRVRETRPNRGAVEKHYEVVAKRFEVGSDSARRAAKLPRREVSSVGVMLFEQARNEFVQALAAGAPGPQRPILAVRGVFSLAPADALTLQRELTEILVSAKRRAAARGQRARNARRYSLTIALIPGEPAER